MRLDKVIHLELWKKLKFDHTIKRYMHNSASVLENETQTPLGFYDTNGSHKFDQTSRPYNNPQEKRTCRIVDFPIPTDHRVKLKESERRISTSTLLWNWKKLWNMKVTIIPIVISAFGTVTKGLIQGLQDLEIRGWVEPIQTTALLRLARILRKVLETCRDLLSLKL